MNYRILLAALACSVAMPAGHTLAEEQEQSAGSMNYPYIQGELIWELESDHTYDSDDPDNKLTDTYSYLELALMMALTPYLSVNTALVFEPVIDPGPAESRFFEDHGLYVQVLNLEVNLTEDTTLLAGKFGPGFGTAWDVTPGIYGTDFAGDYELAEFIGFGVSHGFDAGRFGMVTLGANVFFADTTALSDSLFTRRGQTSLADGGAGNTGEADNFSLTLDGEALPGLEGFSWHLGYRQLSAGLGDVADEQGFVAGFVRETNLGGEQSATFSFEFATFGNFGGSADDADYFTAGLTLADGPWHADFAGTLRNMDVAGGPDVNDVLFQASLGYVDENDIDWNAGYKFTEEGGIDSHTVGVFITKAIEFSTN